MKDFPPLRRDSHGGNGGEDGLWPIVVFLVCILGAAGIVTLIASLFGGR